MVHWPAASEPPWNVEAKARDFPAVSAVPLVPTGVAGWESGRGVWAAVLGGGTGAGAVGSDELAGGGGDADTSGSGGVLESAAPEGGFGPTSNIRGVRAPRSGDWLLTKFVRNFSATTVASCCPIVVDAACSGSSPRWRRATGRVEFPPGLITTAISQANDNAASSSTPWRQKLRIPIPSSFLVRLTESDEKPPGGTHRRHVWHLPIRQSG